MNRINGFTLIEVLIAVLVLAVGLLGLAALQATSIKDNKSAYNRSQATQLAYDLADRMRANVAGVATYTGMLPSAATAKANCLLVAGCSPADMAENDLAEWFNAVNNADNLPSDGDKNTAADNPVASIAVAGSVYTITINWDDNRDGDIDGDGGALEGDTDNDGDTDDDPFFQMRFQL